MSKIEEIKKLYYDPKHGLTNTRKLYEKLKEKGISLKEIKEFIDLQEVGQQYRYKPNKKDQWYPITAPSFSYQIDLIFYPKTKRINLSYDTPLTAIEITSSMGYVIPMKGKGKSEFINAMKQFVEKSGISGKKGFIMSDRGSEFKSRQFRSLMEEHGIVHWMADEGDHTKMGQIEAFNRTVKRLVSKYQSMYKTKKFVDIINDLIYNYNNTVHSTTGYKPSEVGEEERYMIRLVASLKTIKLDRKKNLNVGDMVRILEKKALFGKEGPKWSEKVYKITEDNIKSFKVEGINRRLKHYELLKVNVPAEKNPYEREERGFDMEKHLERVRRGAPLEMPRKDGALLQGKIQSGRG